MAGSRTAAVDEEAVAELDAEDVGGAVGGAGGAGGTCRDLYSRNFASIT